MKEILLRNSTLKVLIDDEDFQKVSQYNWSIHEGYAVTGSTKMNNQQFLQNIVLYNPNKILIDHKDRNKLNYQKENLRFANKSLNSANAGIWKNNTSGYRGVTWNKNAEKWQAQIKINGIMKYIGYFKNKHEAALAYNDAANSAFGEFAYQNLV